MNISEVLFDTIADIIDGWVHYYDQHALLEMADNGDIAKVIVAHLKEDFARIEAINWK